MSRRKAIVLGIFTAWPFLYGLAGTCLSLATQMGWAFSGRPNPDLAFTMWLADSLAFQIVHSLSLLSIVVLLAIYIVFLFKTDRVRQERKALWVIGFFLFHVFTMPLFWYLYVRKDLSQSTPDEGTEREQAAGCEARQMRRRKAIILTTLTAWPYFFIILTYAVMIFSGFERGTWSEISLAFKIWICLFFLTLADGAVLLILYIIYIYKAGRVRQEKRALWTVTLLFASWLAIPVFWYYYVREDLKKSTPGNGAVGDEDPGVF